MIRLALVLSTLVALTACFESHDPAQQELRGEDCYLCHEDTFASGSAQDQHANLSVTSGQAVPTTCQDCHSTIDWTNALGFHPKPMTFVDAVDPTKNETFVFEVVPPAGASLPSAASLPHATVKCLACHDLPNDPNVRADNTNCIKCHPNDNRHQQAHFLVVTTRGGSSYTYNGYSQSEPDFCRTCHPEGLAIKHPDSAFPLNEEHDRPCTQCHDRGPGRPPDRYGQNTNCIGCHGEENRGEHHEGGEVRCFGAFRSNPPSERQPPRQLTSVNYCLACHPRGHGEDDFGSPCPTQIP